VLLSTALFALSALLLTLWPTSAAVIYGAVAIWGLAFGGAATLFMTGLATATGPAQDVAQSMLVTVWNTAIAGGGLVGGALLGALGAQWFSPVVLVMLLAALVILVVGFPRESAPVS